jgi:hypothetical protein
MSVGVTVNQGEGDSRERKNAGTNYLRAHATVRSQIAPASLLQGGATIYSDRFQGDHGQVEILHG